jgi:hypothetical protein
MMWSQGPTLVIVRSSTGHTFGGYANAQWTSGRNFFARNNVGGCFLFLVENPHNDAPTCFECKTTPNALYCAATYGPAFGGCYDIRTTIDGGYDICMHPGADGGQSYTSFPHGYTDTLGRANATFTGARDYTVEDYEVWAVT